MRLPGRLARTLVRTGVACSIGVPALAIVFAAGSAAAAVTVKVTPTTGLRSGQVVRVTVSGEPAGTTLLALECSPTALKIGEDGCENRQNSVFFGSTSKSASTSLRLTAEMETASGPVDCAPSKCLVAVVKLVDNSPTVLGALAVSFSSSSGPGTGDGPPQPPAWSTPPDTPAGRLITPGKAAELSLTADPAGDLASPGSVTGPGTSLAAGTPPAGPESGVGLVQLVLAAPKTSWASSRHTATVVEVTLGSEPSQEVVCFAGSRPFTYAAVFGTISTGSQRLKVAVDAKLSTAGTRSPAVRLIATRLSVVTKANPAYLQMAYAPVLYGRPDTASSDTPLLSFATESPGTSGPKGTMELAYTTIWSKEDAGTSFVPWLEWGEWGRMTDITETVQLEVTPSGRILHPMYDSCGCSAGFPVNETSPLEEEVPFKGKRYGDHLIVVNSSGNDYQTDVGTSAFRMEQAPVAGPSAGEVRESVMDANPWTYRISADELSRWYGDGSTSPTSPEIGDSRQYAIVDVSTTSAGTSAIAVAIKLKGSSAWYRNDFGSGYDLYDGGHGRTAVKLPLGWESAGIAAVQLIAYPTGKAWSVRDPVVTIEGLGSSYGLSVVASPSPVVVSAK